MYGVMNIRKLKANDITGIEREANRTKEEHDRDGIDFPNSRNDWDRTPQNYHIDRAEDWRHAVADRLRAEGIKRPRKDAVLGLSAICTASPEFFKDKSPEQMRRYFEDCRKALIEIYCEGDPSRLINCVVHMDEKTPHMHAFLIPLQTREKEGQEYRALSAKQVIGNRTQMHKAQNRMQELVFSRYGLERGQITIDQEASERKKRTETSDYYKAQKETTLQDLQEAQKLAVSAKLSDMTDQGEKIERAAESLTEARRAFQKVGLTFTEKGKQRAVDRALDVAENSLKLSKECYKSATENLIETNKLVADVDKAINQAAELRLQHELTVLQLEKDSIKERAQALEKREKALQEREAHVEKYIEQEAETRTEQRIATFKARVDYYLDWLGGHAQRFHNWINGLDRQDREKPREQGQQQAQEERTR